MRAYEIHTPPPSQQGFTCMSRVEETTHDRRHSQLYLSHKYHWASGVLWGLGGDGFLFVCFICISSVGRTPYLQLPNFTTSKNYWRVLSRRSYRHTSLKNEKWRLIFHELNNSNHLITGITTHAVNLFSRSQEDNN